jgi:hypothetical protein
MTQRRVLAALLKNISYKREKGTLLSKAFKQYVYTLQYKG